MTHSEKIPVIGAKPDTMVQILPGKLYAPLAPEAVYSHAVVELVPAGGGTFRPVARFCPRMQAVTLRNLRKLGIAISHDGLHRLIRAGFVTGGAVTPAAYQFDYLSYLEHERAVMADPEFWQTKPPGQNFTRLERYMQAL